jgi:hypothetical protein
VVVAAPTHPPLARRRPLEHTNNTRLRPNATLVQIQQPQDPQSLVQLRRYAGYLQILATHAPTLTPILTSPPYYMPSTIVQQLVTSNDICSLVRRMSSHGGVQFSAPVAMDLIMLTSRLCSWYCSDYYDEEEP